MPLIFGTALISPLSPFPPRTRTTQYATTAPTFADVQRVFRPVSRSVAVHQNQLKHQEFPSSGERWSDIMADVESHIMPGITHWQHPRCSLVSSTRGRVCFARLA